MAYAAINASGKVINVRAQIGGTGNIIGQLFPNEVYIHINNFRECQVINFVGPGGGFLHGYISPQDTCPGSMDIMTNYPIRTMENYKIMGVRRNTEVIKPNGTVAGIISAGSQIACTERTDGQIQFAHILIAGMVDGASVAPVYANCFVDMGLEYGSSFSSMTVYGTKPKQMEELG